MKRFEGKVVIVTGAGSGIGAATAKRLETNASMSRTCFLCRVPRPRLARRRLAGIRGHARVGRESTA